MSYPALPGIAAAGSFRHAGVPRFALAPDQWGTDLATTAQATLLTYGYIGGMALTAGAGPTNIASGTVALTNNATNYVERTLLGVVSANTVGFSIGSLPMAVVVTAAGVITAVTDSRGLSGQRFAQSGTGAVARSASDKMGETISVFDFGAKGDGITDDSAAIQAAITAGAAKGGARIWFPPGTYVFGTTLTIPGHIWLVGAGLAGTTLSYTGAGTAITQPTPGTRIYDISIRDLNLTTATGATGIDLDSVSTSNFEHLLVNGFSSVGISIHSAVGGGAVYNRFHDVTVQNCPTGYKIAASSSNANVFHACRGNVCTARCWDIQDSNDNTLIGCQAESSGVGFFFDAALPGSSDVNRVIACRAEGNTTGFMVNTANVRYTVLRDPWLNNTTDIVDNGTNTEIVSSGLVQYASPTQDRPFRFIRSSNAGSQLAAFWIQDPVTTSGTPVTLLVETERTGWFARFRRGGVTYFDVDTSGLVKSGPAVGSIAGSRFMGASTTSGDKVGYSLYVNEGVHNRQAQFYLDDTAAEFGLLGTASSGVPTFVLTVGATRVLTATASGASVTGTLAVSSTTIIGSDPGGAQQLRIGGAVVASGLITASAGLTVAAGALTANGTVTFNGGTAGKVAYNSSRTLSITFAGGGTSGGGIYLLQASNGTIASPTATALGDLLGQILAEGHDGSSYITTASINVNATQAWSVGANGSKITVKTTPNGSTTNTIALTIDQDQSVTCAATIATASPGSGAGLWKLGKYITAAVSAPLTTNYVEVMIDGTLRKLLVGT